MEVGAIRETVAAAENFDIALDTNNHDTKNSGAVAEIDRTASSEYDENPKGGQRGPVRPFSPWFTIFCAGFALISDGYQNNLLTLINPLFAKLYGTAYSAAVKTRVSNALLVGAILGQLSVGFICDRFGRKVMTLLV